MQREELCKRMAAWQVMQTHSCRQSPRKNAWILALPYLGNLGNQKTSWFLRGHDGACVMRGDLGFWAVWAVWAIGFKSLRFDVLHLFYTTQKIIRI